MKKLENSKVLVIGGSGFIGGFVVSELLKHQVSELVIYDNFARGKSANIIESLKDPRCSVYPFGGDVRETDILDTAMKGIDYVFHLAAMWLLHCKDYPRTAFDVNIAGTFNVLEACVKNNVKKLISSSSASVYGDASEVPMTESHPFNNKNFYGATKIAGEAMATAFNDRYGLEVVSLRYMNVYGPGQIKTGKMSALIGIFETQYENKKPLTIVKPGSQMRDFTHIDDIIEGCYKAVIKNKNNEYMLSSGKKYSILQIAKMFKTKCEYISSRPGDRKDSIVLNNNAKKILGFKARRSINDYIKNFINTH